MSSKIAAMVRIRDATDNSGGATFPTFMFQNMRDWEREGLVEIHYCNTQLIARITDKGRNLAKKVGK